MILRTTVSQLKSASNSIESQISKYNLEPKKRYLCTLLYDELSSVISSNLDGNGQVQIKVGKNSREVSIRLKLDSDKNILDEGTSQSSDEKTEIEQRIRDTVLESNSE
ncbi:MAG: hypothetical protein ACSW73_03060, partial [Spirochaetales bacterium]